MNWVWKVNDIVLLMDPSEAPLLLWAYERTPVSIELTKSKVEYKSKSERRSVHSGPF